MKENNTLYLKSFSNVSHFLNDNAFDFYYASLGTYSKVFKRDAFACISFFTPANNQYYMYFNSSYNKVLNRMFFTSISIVNWITKDLLNKFHINTIEDLDSVFSYINSLS